MSGVQFEEDYNRPNFGNQNSSEKGLTGWLIKKGIVKDEKSAQMVLISVMIICFGITGFLIFGDGSNANTNNVNIEESSFPGELPTDEF